MFMSEFNDEPFDASQDDKADECEGEDLEQEGLPSGMDEPVIDAVEERDDELLDEGEGDDDDAAEDARREVVVPGQVIGTKSKDLLSGYGTITTKDGNIVSLYVGFIQQRGKYVNVQPFKGCYIPHVDDKVIGKVVDKNVVLWKLDINSPYIAILRPSDAGDPRQDSRGYGGGNQQNLRKRFDRGPRKESTVQYVVGDMLIAKILRFDRTTEPALTTVGPDLGPIKGGFFTTISVPKIPRLIGKSGSMIRLLNSLTTCKVFVAQNGVVWVRGKRIDDERIILKAIEKIEEEATAHGLTDRIKEFVEAELQKIKNK